MTLVHSLKLPSHMKAQSFEQFAKTRLLPALHMGPTRAGQLDGARLLRNGEDFLLLSEWEGIDIDFPRIDDPAVEKLFEAYDIETALLGEFREVARRPEPGEEQ